MNISGTTSHSVTQPTSDDIPSTLTAIKTRSTAQNNEEIYQKVFSTVTERYKAFNPDTEIGHLGKPGVTADIESIALTDTIAVLQHISANDNLLEECKKNSAKAAFFDKLYLMSNSEQGWNLRLHFYDIRGSELDTDEKSPHEHRWTLGSKILAGGYINIIYKIATVEKWTRAEFIYAVYELLSSKSQTSSETRPDKYISEAEVTPIKRTLYAQGDLRHFPITVPHSVDTRPAIMGTTITLAHTSKAATETSISYQKSNDIKALPEVKTESKEEFKLMLQFRIVHLQILALSDKLHTELSSKFEQGLPLTYGEEKHLHDYKEPNYVETSLLPALAIFQMEQINDVEHAEFATDTANLIKSELADIDSDALERLIKSNQGNIFDNLLTIEIDEELAKLLEEHAIEDSITT